MDIRQILENTTNIAVIGLSKNELKDSYQVSMYMRNSGYNIIPINPTADFIMGVKSYENNMILLLVNSVLTSFTKF